jgi:O-antigen biosynthesis alpha-1,2-rhamnosyltransferase
MDGIGAAREPERRERAPRVWIDCTGTYLGDLNTGIQRVVRNLVQYGLQAEVPCRPAAFVWPRWYGIDWQPSAAREEPRRAGDEPGSSLRSRSAADAADSRTARLRRTVRKALVPRTLVRCGTNLVRHLAWGHRYGIAAFRPGDVLLLPDGTWGYPTWPSIASLHRCGVKVGVLVHDLIPVTHPQFFVPDVQRVFQAWWQAVAPRVDFFVGNSRATRDTVRDRVLTQFPQAGFTEESFSWFPMGIDLDHALPGGSVRPTVRQALGSEDVAAPAESSGHSSPRDRGAAYLTVSTIEPRKNHGLLLDAFERLWQTRPEARLCLVGKRGWLCDDLLSRVRRHPQWSQRLFWFHDLSDTELDYCYRHAKAFLFPSFIEGYGLPIVEALQRGLPVFASDIPVHREVAQDFARYFDPHRPETLAELLLDFETGRLTGEVRAAGEFQATDWNTSVRELLTTCLRLAGHAQPKKTPA